MQIVLKTFWSLITAIWDRLVLHTPLYLIYKLRSPGVAFLVHPRDITDIYRPFPAFRWLPDQFTHWFGAHIGAITLSTMFVPRIHGGSQLRAKLLSIVMDPKMVEKGDWEVLMRNIALLYQLAARKNLRLVGLGAWLPFLTKYGAKYAKQRDQEGTGPAITTGHALTAWCIRETFRTIVSQRHAHAAQVTVAVVGAAGSTGSLAARLLRQLGQVGHTYIDLHLIDLSKKQQLLQKLGADLQATVSTEMSTLRGCDYVVVVTNAGEAIIRSEHVKRGAVIIDDSQPRNTAPELNEKAFVVDVLARVPGLDVNFDFGFHTDDTAVTFSCLAETLLVGLAGHQGDFSFGNGVSEDMVVQLEDYLEQAKHRGVHIEPALWYSFAEPMPDGQVQHLLAQQPVITMKAAE